MVCRALLFFGAVLAVPAQAASPLDPILCAPSPQVQKRLTAQYGAERVAMGVRDRESIIEVWNAERSDDWTLVITYASGNSCIVAMGEGWTTLMAPGEDPTGG